MLYLVSEARVCCYLHVFFAVSKQQRKETLYIAPRAETEVFAEFSDQKLGQNVATSWRLYFTCLPQLLYTTLRMVYCS